ncbi:MAG: extracellular solute-binding protein [Bifidobacteriaceae bacterium]|jgi:ABC-type glycerol-3-phosphate transport system substrate-binding protein|nr:extracellular solute-binding protein [Bifidobacteriaceae bacterium]
MKRQIKRQFCGRALSIAAAAALAAAALAACSGGSGPSGQDGQSGEPGEPIHITIWNTLEGTHAEAVEQTVKDFNAANPDVVVEVQAQPLTDYDAKVLQAVRNGTGPDIIDVYHVQATQYIEAGLTADLTGYIADPEIGIPDFDANLTEAWLESIAQWGDSKRYLVPSDQTGPVLFYNKTLFESLGLDVPTTWDELAAAGRQITEATGKPAFGFDDLVSTVIAMAAQDGQGFVDVAAKQATFDNEVFKEKLDWLAGLLEEGVFRLVGEDFYFSGPFGAQSVAAYIGSSAGHPFVAESVAGAFEFGVAPIPQGGSAKYAPGWGFSYLVFASDEATERAAFRYISYYTSPEVMGEMATVFGSIAPYRDARQTPVFQEFLTTNEAAAALEAQVEYSVFEPAATGVSEAQTELLMAVEAVLTGLKDADTALAEAAAAADLALGQ